MPEKFQNRYRIPSARLQNWDYGRNAAYFITICTQHRECWFGHIHHGIIVLSEIGEIAHRLTHEKLIPVLNGNRGFTTTLSETMIRFNELPIIL